MALNAVTFTYITRHTASSGSSRAEALLAEPALCIQSRHGSCSRRRDGLPVHVSRNVARNKHALHACLCGPWLVDDVPVGVHVHLADQQLGVGYVPNRDEGRVACNVLDLASLDILDLDASKRIALLGGSCETRIS